MRGRYNRRGGYGGYPPYVPVAVRREKALKEAKKLEKSGCKLSPVEISGRAIAKTFWGKSWCEHLESFSDFSNRLPRGQRYARNGSVIDLQIATGTITALVSGSEIYKQTIIVKTLPRAKWSKIKKTCSGQIGSLLNLLQGQFSDEVMAVIAEPQAGLFPKPTEIKMNCSCPDFADLCKHLAAILYGVGNRLDHEPELLFKLRGVNPNELIDEALTDADFSGGSESELADSDLSSLFGIELEAEDLQQTPQPATQEKKVSKKKTRPAKKSAVKKAQPVKKSGVKKARKKK